MPNAPETKHTPGPWTWTGTPQVEGGRPFHAYLVDPTGRKIASIWGKAEEKVANAHLIATAPDLYWSLRDILSLVEVDEAGGNEITLAQHVFTRGRAALAKAEGRL